MKSKFIPTVAVVLAFGAGVIMHIATTHAAPATITSSNPRVIMEPKTEPLPITTPEPTPGPEDSPLVSPSVPLSTVTGPQAPVSSPAPAIGSDVMADPTPVPKPANNRPNDSLVSGSSVNSAVYYWPTH